MVTSSALYRKPTALTCGSPRRETVASLPLCCDCKYSSSALVNLLTWHLVPFLLCSLATGWSFAHMGLHCANVSSLSSAIRSTILIPSRLSASANLSISSCTPASSSTAIRLRMVAGLPTSPPPPKALTASGNWAWACSSVSATRQNAMVARWMLS